jgi:hypothetical protein
MIIFDLRCADGHVFEAWFGNSTDFADQLDRNLLSCPLCGNSDVSKAPMAANVTTKSNQFSGPAQPMAKAVEPSAQEVKAFLATMAKAQQDMLKTSEWVGRDFERKARAMDAGEIDTATIHGEVSQGEAQSLIEDGIAVMPLPFPVIPRSKQN